jgi:hypothetical protein
MWLLFSKLSDSTRAPGRSRTDYPLFTKQVLYQVSYRGKSSYSVVREPLLTASRPGRIRTLNRRVWSSPLYRWSYWPIRFSSCCSCSASRNEKAEPHLWEPGLGEKFLSWTLAGRSLFDILAGGKLMIRALRIRTCRWAQNGKRGHRRCSQRAYFPLPPL